MSRLRFASAGLVAAALIVPATLPGPAVNAAPHPSVEPRVVNGTPGPKDDFESLVAIGDRQRYETLGMEKAQSCGGTLATPELVITAAHCVAGSRARELVVGHFPDGSLASADGVVVRVRDIRVHRRYRADTQANDIAVLTLRSPLDDVPTLLPATPEEATALTAPRSPARVAGWGAVNRREPWRYKPLYRTGRVVIFPDASCGGGEPFTYRGVTFRGYGPRSAQPRVMICAEGVRNGAPVDSCVGDSGGPLIGGTGADRRLIGIVSWGLPTCASDQGSGVYTRVSAFTRFLISAGVPLDLPVTNR